MNSKKTTNTKKALESIKAFLPDDKLVGKIIELCDLHPIDKSWRKWTDHLGNFLQIRNKKVISFSQDPLGNEEIITDIYFKASPNKLSQISDWAFVSFGKDQTNSFNALYMWFLGRDKRLRFCSFHNGYWLKNEPPLISGVDTLRPVLKNLNVNGYRQANILHIKGPIAIDITRSWATQWPPKQKLIDEMNRCNQTLAKVVEKIT